MVFKKRPKFPQFEQYILGFTMKLLNFFGWNHLHTFPKRCPNLVVIYKKLLPGTDVMIFFIFR
jgi:hypothetical protein